MLLPQSGMIQGPGRGQDVMGTAVVSIRPGKKMDHQGTSCTYRVSQKKSPIKDGQEYLCMYVYMSV